MSVDAIANPDMPASTQGTYLAEVTLRAAHRPETTTTWGSRIQSELIHFKGNDGNRVVREVTIAQPNSTATAPLIVETDPWTTGEKGFNRDRIEAYTRIGYAVLWLHHGGRYSPLAKDKSVSRGAHQMHAMLNSFSEHSDFDTSNVIVGGYSRGAMTADKFIAQAAQYGRNVIYSDTEAPCFVQDMNFREKMTTLAKQLPTEVLGLGHVAFKLLSRAAEEQNPLLVAKYLQTLDVHPKNLAQEALWAHALINANVGYSTRSMPTHTQGVRTFFKDDHMSQMVAYHDLYSAFPNLRVLYEKGPHFAGALPEYQRKKQARFTVLINQLRDNNMSLTGISLDEIVPNRGFYSVA